MQKKKNEEIIKALASMFADKNRNDDIEVAIEEGFDVIMDKKTGEVYFEKKFEKPNRKERRGRKYHQRMDDIKKHRLGTSRKYTRNQVDAYWVDDEKVTHWVGDPEECNGLPYDEFQKYWNNIPWVNVKGTKVRDSGYKSCEKGHTAWSRKVRHSDKKECFDFLCEEAVVETVWCVTVAEDDGFGFDEGFVNGEFIGYTTCTDWRVGMPMKVRKVMDYVFFENFQEYQNKKWHDLVGEYIDVSNRMKMLENMIADEFGGFRVSEAMIEIEEM